MVFGKSFSMDMTCRPPVCVFKITNVLLTTVFFGWVAMTLVGGLGERKGKGTLTLDIETDVHVPTICATACSSVHQESEFVVAAFAASIVSSSILFCCLYTKMGLLRRYAGRTIRRDRRAIISRVIFNAALYCFSKRRAAR